MAVADALKLGRVREESPAWSLLAATNAPAILAVLEEAFHGDNRTLAGSELLMQVDSMLLEIREQTKMELPKSAAAYVGDWVKAGYLVRRSPQGETEEFYELSSNAHVALEYVEELVAPQRVVTGSRLGILYSSLTDLAADTDPDEQAAIARLEAQRERIDARIAAIRERGVNVVSENEALERAREVLTLARGLPTDFARMRTDVEKVDSELRESIVESEVNAGEVLNSVFRGVDLIEDSEAGRAFRGFYEVFLNSERSAQIDAVIDAIMSRDFAAKLSMEEREELRGLMRTLDESSGQVHDSMTGLSRSLRRFVQSREAESQQALITAINEAQNLAMKVGKQGIAGSARIGVELELTARQPQSISSWQLYDPADYRIKEDLVTAETGSIDVEALLARIRETEIDWQELTANVNAVVGERGVATIGEVLESRPATQGLASVVGLIKLGVRHGERANGTELVRWNSGTGKARQARVNRCVFTDQISDTYRSRIFGGSHG